MKELVKSLNRYRDYYYNKSISLVSDLEFDTLYDELVNLEKESGVILANSPTQTVGYEVKSSLAKVEHAYPPMLSLDKTKDVEKLISFIGNEPMFIMGKMDGLTCRITYNDGVLVRAETRGDGRVGEDITHNIKTVSGVPLTIPFKSEVLVDGEIIMNRSTFNSLKDTVLDSSGKPYKNPRNLASGSIRLLDSEKCASRGLHFIAWRIHGSNDDFGITMCERLLKADNIGFEMVPHRLIPKNPTKEVLEELIEYIKNYCAKKEYPIDGCVISYMNIEKFEELGYTSHHSKAQIAFKFYDDLYDSVVRKIDWTLGKTGVITPTAIFDPIDIDGTEVERASLHNLTIMRNLGIKIGSECKVFKANMIIPQIESCTGGDSDIIIPKICPCCGKNTTEVKSKDSDAVFLMCLNDDCVGKKLSLFKTFVGKTGFDIDGLGEKTLEAFISKGYLKKFEDIFKLSKYSEEIKASEGFEETSVTNLMTAIETSRDITLDRLLVALSVANLGKTYAKELAEHFDYDIDALLKAVAEDYDFSEISGFGDVISNSIKTYFKTYDISSILSEIRLIKPKKATYQDTPLSGKTFCITGTFPIPRSRLEAILISLGGVSMSGVSSKTHMLFVGEDAGSKVDKAWSLGIPTLDVIATKAFLERYGYTW